MRAGAAFLPGAGLADSAQAGTLQCGPPAVVSEVAPGVFVRQGAVAMPDGDNRGAIANIGFVIGAEGVAVIDTGGSYCDGMGLKAAIRARTALPVTYVINTHVHPDHIFGNAAFAGEGVSFVAHRNLPRALGERGEHGLQSYAEQVGPEAMQGTKIIPPTELVTDTLRLDLGGRALVLIARPAAHTDADLTVFDEATATLWTGDLIFLDHIPVLDGSLKGWLALTAALMQQPAARIVPGHGPPSAPWPEAGEKQLRYLQRLAEDLRGAIRAGKSISEAAAVCGTGEKDGWQLFGAYNSRNALTGFAELEWD
ncbi:quinoprotein relay system zinc metallohydrolase 2 [Rhodomicrobium vannielii]|uniref:quinoprotein relay system zinc metallohydrolase 2 n=1 Tax=Rhodomicrobium vannielii TaxID=1069 RepID=UPI002478014D|nr:quinoprotein relay system zinc metallohydrolase 2 [Rhodomicrobium vannielii]